MIDNSHSQPSAPTVPNARKPTDDAPAIDAAASFQAIRSARAFEDIAAQIRAELAAGRLKVGSRLPSERALSEQFNVSRNTLREALRSLEHAGLIRLQKGASGGAFISERSGEAVVTGLLDLYHVGAIGPAQLTQARIWLESIIVREACQRATPEDLAELYRNIEQAQAATTAGDFDLRSKTHIDFHRILARMTGNPIMVVMMDALLTVLLHFIRSIGEKDNPYTLPSRRRFMKHMEEGNVEAAVSEMETMLKRLEKSYLSRLEPLAPADAAPVPPAPRAARTPARKAAAAR
jgi:GntR family transcriptional repressor for pyruvate dehydrogenase complex